MCRRVPVGLTLLAALKPSHEAVMCSGDNSAGFGVAFSKYAEHGLGVPFSQQTSTTSLGSLDSTYWAGRGLVTTLRGYKPLHAVHGPLAGPASAI